MACPQSLEFLSQISNHLANIYDTLKMHHEMIHGRVNTFIDRTQDGWTRKKTGKAYTFEQTITYDGVTDTVSLVFPVRMSIMRIDQIWNDATAKDIEIELFSDASNASFADLKKVLANTDTSMIISPTTIDELAFAPNGKISFVYANNTAGKTCKIVIVAREL